MRVAINALFWDQPRTGSGQYLRHLWAALNDFSGRHSSGPSLDRKLLFAYSTSAETLEERPSGSSVQSMALPVVGGRSANLDKLVWEQWGVVREAQGVGADLLHVPYLTAPLRSSLPFVVTAHDMIPWVVPGYAGSLPLRLYMALTVAGVRRARLIMADSEASRQDAIRVLKVSPRRVRTVYLGVEPPPAITREELDEVRSRMGLPAAFAFYMGGFDTRKNVPLLLRAWRGALRAFGAEWCADEQPALAIGGAVPEPGGVFPDVRREASALGLGERGGQVRFLGRISERDKPLLMAAARIFVYPSLYEGFGLDPLEAMSVGCPVVSSSGGSLEEVVSDGGLLVTPGNEKALCQAIVAAWRDPSLRRDLRRRGQVQASRFTWEQTARQTRQVYLAALGKRAGK